MPLKKLLMLINTLTPSAKNKPMERMIQPQRRGGRTGGGGVMMGGGAWNGGGVPGGCDEV